MGAGSSAEAVSGVSLNPRLAYANDRAHTEGQHVLLDTPSLVKLQTGTVRYRYINDGKEIDNNRIEKPHESQSDLNKKGGYFYHARLKDLSYDADPKQEDSVKFCYVYKGADKTRQKQLYYVFGKGLKTNENGFIEPKYKGYSDSTEEDPNKFYKFHGHMYYDIQDMEEALLKVMLNVIVEAAPTAGVDSDIVILGDGKVETDNNDIELSVKGREKTGLVKRRLAIKLYKPAANIHLYRAGVELANEDDVFDAKLKRHAKKKWRVVLVPKLPDRSA